MVVVVVVVLVVVVVAVVVVLVFVVLVLVRFLDCVPVPLCNYSEDVIQTSFGFTRN